MSIIRNVKFGKLYKNNFYIAIFCFTSLLLSFTLNSAEPAEITDVSWTLNIGGEHYYSIAEKSNQELSVWSTPNSGSFSETDAFRTIVFE